MREEGGPITHVLRNPIGLRDTTPRNPAAADDIWLYSAVVLTASRLGEGLAGLYSQRLPRARYTAWKKIVICRDEEGERRDSNPRPPGPQPAPTGTSEAYTSLSGDLRCVLSRFDQMVTCPADAARILRSPDRCSGAVAGRRVPSAGTLGGAAFAPTSQPSCRCRSRREMAPRAGLSPGPRSIGPGAG